MRADDELELLRREVAELRAIVEQVKSVTDPIDQVARALSEQQPRERHLSIVEGTEVA